MSSTQKQAYSNNGDSSNSTNDWEDELDAYAQILARSDDLDLRTNFGHGNYDKREFYQQIRNFQRAAKAMESFSRILLERAIYQTKVSLAIEGINFYNEKNNSVEEYDPVDVDEEHRTKVVLEKGEEIWKKLNDTNNVLSEKQIVAILQKTGHDLDWQSFYAQTLVFFHESTRSINAELIRDFLTGIKELRGDVDDDTANALLGGKKS